LCRVIDGALRVGGGLEDRAVVVLQNRAMRRYISMIVADLRDEFEIGATAALFPKRPSAALSKSRPFPASSLSLL
jgi:hypothetical protein